MCHCSLLGRGCSQTRDGKLSLRSLFGLMKSLLLLPKFDALPEAPLQVLPCPQSLQVTRRRPHLLQHLVFLLQPWLLKAQRHPQLLHLAQHLSRRGCLELEV
ncbi:hypothetical protein PS2_011697 [Malus domestica]